jgi:hypothetical protein
MRCIFLALAAASVICLAVLPAAQAQTVWSGFNFSFTKDDNANATDSDNWDIITSNVAIIRSDTGGIYNPFEEGFYDSESPADTEWATDFNNPGDEIAATNYAALDFVPWLNAYVEGLSTGQLPTSLIGRNAVVHLISDDIYLDLRFTAWTASAMGGGFAYQSAVGPELPPTTGDYSGNDVVDAADYVFWRKAFHESATPPGNGADGNASGVVEGRDYIFWRERYGDVHIGSGATLFVVPEPTAAVLVTLASCALTTGRGKRHTINSRRYGGRCG